MSADRPVFAPAHPAPGHPGVVGESPNRTEPEAEAADDLGALDEAPDGMTPSDTTGSDESSLPPGAG